MQQVLSIEQITRLNHLKAKGKTLVLVGGCFDVLHPGHTIFLQKAKEAGDILIVLLESDQKIRKLKGLPAGRQGVKRPVHNQIERTQVLLALKSVDEVIPLKFMETEKEYDEIVLKIKPDIIATTAGHPNAHHYQRTAKLVGAKLKYVTKMVGDYSSTKILNHQKYL